MDMNPYTRTSVYEVEMKCWSVAQGFHIFHFLFNSSLSLSIITPGKLGTRCLGALNPFTPSIPFYLKTLHERLLSSETTGYTSTLVVDGFRKKKEKLPSGLRGKLTPHKTSR
jgi:hypothetical protein